MDNIKFKLALSYLSAENFKLKRLSNESYTFI